MILPFLVGSRTRALNYTLFAFVGAFCKNSLTFDLSAHSSNQSRVSACDDDLSRMYKLSGREGRNIPVAILRVCVTSNFKRSLSVTSCKA